MSPYAITDGMVSGPILCRYHSCWELKSSTAMNDQKIAFHNTPLLSLLHSFCSLFYDAFGAFDGVFTDISFMADHLLSALWLLMSLCSNHFPLQMELLWPKLTAELIYGHKHLIGKTCPFVENKTKQNPHNHSRGSLLGCVLSHVL